MAITREEVLHVAKLARLELSDDEVTRFQEQLSAILEAVSKVSELDLSDVPPTSHPLEIANAWDEDVPRPCLPLDEVFANAPDRDDDYFRTPTGMTIDTLRLTAEGARDLLESRRDLGRRALRRVPRRDRGAQRRAERVPHAGRRSGRRRDPDRAQGRDLDQGRPHDGRLEDPRELRAGLRLDRRRELQGARPAAPRQDEHRRVRDGLLDRELGVRAVAQPVGSLPRAGRLRRRLGGRGLRRARAVGARLRHGRLGQAAVRVLRQRRPAPDLRHRLALRDRRVRVEPRPGRAGGEDGARLRLPVLR